MSSISIIYNKTQEYIVNSRNITRKLWENFRAKHFLGEKMRFLKLITFCIFCINSSLCFSNTLFTCSGHAFMQGWLDYELEVSSDPLTKILKMSVKPFANVDITSNDYATNMMKDLNPVTLDVELNISSRDCTFTTISKSKNLENNYGLGPLQFGIPKKETGKVTSFDDLLGSVPYSKTNLLANELGDDGFVASSLECNLTDQSFSEKLKKVCDELSGLDTKVTVKNMNELANFNLNLSHIADSLEIKEVDEEKEYKPKNKTFSSILEN